MNITYFHKIFTRCIVCFADGSSVLCRPFVQHNTPKTYNQQKQSFKLVLKNSVVVT